MKKIKKALIYICIGLVLLWTIFPIIYMIMTSLKSADIILAIPPRFVFKPSLNQYRKLFLIDSYYIYLVNSFVVASVATLGALFIGSMMAFAYDLWSFKFKKLTYFLILFTRIFPPITTLIPVFLIIRSLNLLDTKTGLILLYIAFQIPLITIIMREFFHTIPKELYECAYLEGATQIQVFFKISMPLALPGIVSSSILVFIFNWNEFIFAFILTSFKARTLPLGVYLFTESEQLVQWASISALGVITMLPIVLFTLLLSRYLIKGLKAGAIKG